MALKEHLKSTRVKTVPIVLCAPYVQKQEKVKAESCFINEMGFALMAVNIRKYTAINNKNGTFSPEDIRKNANIYLFLINISVLVYLKLVLSQPRFSFTNVIYYRTNLLMHCIRD